MQLHRVRDDIHRLGAELIIIGNGSPTFARAFREDFQITTPLYTDPSRATYRLLGFERGVRRTLLSLVTWRAGVRALRNGFRQGRTRGDPWQLGGVLVVRPGGALAYRHASAVAGDHPPVEEVLAALQPER